MKFIISFKNKYVFQILFLSLTVGPIIQLSRSEDIMATNWGAENAGFKLSLSFEQQSAEYIYPINAVLVLSNATDQVLQTIRAPIKKAYRILVTDIDGTSIPLTKYGQQQMRDDFNTTVQPIGIQPGKVFTEKILLNRWYDLSAKGTYSVEISRIVADPVVKGWTYVTSNIVQLDIP